MGFIEPYFHRREVIGADAALKALVTPVAKAFLLGFVYPKNNSYPKSGNGKLAGGVKPSESWRKQADPGR